MAARSKLTHKASRRRAYLCGEVAACLELLEEGGHEDGGEEEDHAPEEDIGDVGSVVTTGGALKLPVQHLALLLAPQTTGWRWR